MNDLNPLHFTFGAIDVLIWVYVAVQFAHLVLR